MADEKKITGNKLEATQVGETRTPDGRRLRAYTIQPVLKEKGTGNDSADADKTTSLPDPFKDHYGSDKLIPPIIDPGELAILPEYCSELGPCIETMEINVPGFGYRIAERKKIIDTLESLSPGKKLPEEAQREIALERLRMQNWFDQAGGIESFTKLRRKLRVDLETIGWCLAEVVPNGDSLPSYLNHVPAFEVRLSKVDDEHTEYKESRLEIGENGHPKITEIIAFKRFRRFCQIRNNVKVWFKEMGDPRTIDRKTGEIIDESKLESWKKGGGKEAHPAIYRKLYCTRSAYGLPRYKGSLLQIYGVRRADEVNYTTFTNNNIPSMMIMVENGGLTDGSIDRLTEFVTDQVKGDANWSKFLVVEAEPYESDATGQPEGKVKLNLEKLGNVQQKDELFQEFVKNSLDRIRRNWRITPIYLGRTDDYTRATAAEARRLTDEQVFQPEREDEDFEINQQLTLRLGFKWHEFKTRTPNITDTESLVKLLGAADKSGGLTPEISRSILEIITGLDLGNVSDKIDGDIPFWLQIVREQMQGKINKSKGGGSGADIDLVEAMVDLRRKVEDRYAELQQDHNIE